MTIANVVWLATFAMLMAIGQLFFKQVGLVMKGQPFLDSFALALRTPALYAALALYGASTFLWIWILSKVSLSQAYPWAAVGMAIVPLLARLVFDERVAGTYWIGIAFVMFGVVLTQYAVNGE